MLPIFERSDSMKKAKLRIPILCVAALMVCVIGATSAWAATQGPANEEPAKISEHVMMDYRNVPVQIIPLSAVEEDAAPSAPQIQDQPSDAIAEEPEADGLLSRYVSLFDSPAFVVGFVLIFAIVAFVMLKTDFVAKFRSKHKSPGKGPSHRTDGL